MRDGRGALFGVKSGGKTYGHTMVMIHFDEVNDCILYIDNSDKLLKTRSMSMAEFNKIWDRWVLVIYADHDSIPYRIPTAVP
jgi:predicted double-glycine peptidase